MKKIAAIALFALASPAWAWDGEVNGTVDRIEISTIKDVVLVYVAGAKVMCNKGPDYAVISEHDTNGKFVISALMSSQLTGGTVTIYSTNVNGTCKIGGLRLGGLR